MSFGLTPQGFAKKSQDDCLQEMKTDLWNTVSNKLNLASAAPFGQIIGIIAERESLIWDALEAVHGARVRDSSSGSALRQLGLLTGTKPQTATPTQVACSVNVNSGFDALPGTMVAHVVNDPTQTYTNETEVHNTGGVAASLPVTFVAQSPGALACPAGQLTVIAQSLAGWNSITNALDGVEGLDDDTDATLRIRQETQLQGEGAATVDAIRSDVLKNLSSNITNCAVISNETDATDANGLPPHSFEVIARGLLTDAPSSANLANQIAASKDAGDHAFGQSSLIVTDSQGNTHNIGYTWVADQLVYLSIDITINPKLYPVDGDTQVANALLAIGAAYNPGDTVIAAKVKAACFSVVGVNDSPALRLGFSAVPAGTANLAIGVRQIAKFDSTRIVVNHV